MAREMENIWAEASFGLLLAVLLLLFHVGLPVLGMEQRFLFGIAVWLTFLGIGAHLTWRLTHRLPRQVRFACVLVFGAAVVAFTQNGLRKSYWKEYPNGIPLGEFERGVLSTLAVIAVVGLCIATVIYYRTRWKSAAPQGGTSLLPLPGAAELPPASPTIDEMQSRLATHQADIDAAKEKEEQERQQIERQIEQERPSVDQLRVLRSAYLAKAIDYTAEVFSAEFTIQSQTVGYITPEKSLICDLIGHYVYRELMAAREELDRRLATPPDRLSSIVAAFCAALTQYGIFLGYFDRQGSIIYTENEFHSSGHYEEIYRRHQSLCEQLRLARPREDIGRIAADTAGLCQLLKRPLALDIRVSIDQLSQSWDAHTPEERLTVGLLKREFVVLSVTNRTQKDLRNIVATCQFNNGGKEFCLWSSESGNKFVSGGRQAADLSVGDTRLLIVAQGIRSDEQWARVSLDQPFHLVRGEAQGVITYLDKVGNVLTLCAGSVLATARFQAEGIDEKRSYRLTFSSEKKPQVSVIE